MHSTTSLSRFLISWASRSNHLPDYRLPHRKTLLFLAILSCTAGCGAPEQEHRMPESGLAAQSLPAQESWNITLTLSDSGRNSDVVKARHASEYHKGEKKELFVDGGVTVTIYDKKGGKPTVMTAGRGVVHDNQDIEAFDNVIIHTADGTVIQTDYVIRTSHNRKLRSDKRVLITRPTQTIRGSGFESDEDMLHYRIFQASGESESTK